MCDEHSRIYFPPNLHIHIKHVILYYGLHGFHVLMLEEIAQSCFVYETEFKILSVKKKLKLGKCWLRFYGDKRSGCYSSRFVHKKCL